MERHSSQLRLDPRPRRALAAAVVVLVTMAALTAPLAAQTVGASIPDLLSRHGIRPIEPPSPASDFTLPNLAGGETALSDYFGSWVVLTFFATWCGPCRGELPSLERLHQERAAAGVVVLAVSVDDERAPLEPFVRQLGLTFPILWDETRQVGAAYRASSIPMSYLVDPRGRLAGVSRGARDWAVLAPMLDDALAALPATRTAEPQPDVYADAGQPVATPTVTDPPTADLELSTATPRAGEPFFLDIDLHWAGNFEEYLPHPPKIELPEGVAREGVTAESSSRAGRHQVTYRLTLRAAEPATYALGPVELSYTPRFEATPMASRIEGPTVEVLARTVLGMRPSVVAAGSGGLVVLGLLVWGLRRRLRRGASGGASEAERFDELRERFEAARKKRLQGDGAGCLLVLAELAAALGGRPSDDAADDALERAVERARYGGEVPPAEELDNLQREIERRLEELRPDPEKAERAAVRLRGGETA